MYKKISKLIICFAVLGFIFALGYYVGVDRDYHYNKPENLDFSLFWEAYNKLSNLYVDSKELDNEKIVHGAIRGMLNTLEDPYTRFFDKEESKEFLEDVSGYYEGLGMEVGLRNGDLTVISPIKKTPADRAGIRSGDLILKINDQLTDNMGLEEAVDLMRGEEGTKVTLLVGRDQETEEIILQRARIQIPSVDWKILEDEIVYLQIYYFHQELIPEFNQIVPQITTIPANKMIIDLRNNPGGSLNAAVELAEFFLERGDIIVKSQGINGEVIKSYKAKGNSVTFDHDLIILVNEGSASASEILAGALKYHRDAIIVGEKSFGKGSIQTLVNLSDMSHLKITISNWVMPDDKLITDIGITPDYEVKMTPDDVEMDFDPQLEKAIEIIKD